MALCSYITCNWVKITSVGRRYTCPMKEIDGKQNFRFKNQCTEYGITPQNSNYKNSRIWAYFISLKISKIAHGDNIPIYDLRRDSTSCFILQIV